MMELQLTGAILIQELFINKNQSAAEKPQLFTRLLKVSRTLFGLSVDPLAKPGITYRCMQMN
jgi:hypothetical protein